MVATHGEPFASEQDYFDEVRSRLETLVIEGSLPADEFVLTVDRKWLRQKSNHRPGSLRLRGDLSLSRPLPLVRLLYSPATVEPAGIRWQSSFSSACAMMVAIILRCVRHRSCRLSDPRHGVHERSFVGKWARIC